MNRIVIILFFALLSVFIVSSACTKDDKPSEKPPVEEPDDSTAAFLFGADLSYVNQIEDHGGTYNVSGEFKDPYSIFKEQGAHMIRLRLWHNPSWVYDLYSQEIPLYSGFPDVLKSIERAKGQGLQVNLDFHYSDTWADPGHQDVPQAWKNITSIEVLSDSVYNYTYKVLSDLAEKGLLPEMVQIGNETNCGMMFTNAPAAFPKLSVCDGNWSNAGKVFNAGINAVRAIDNKYNTKTLIALHVADPKNLDWWFTDMINKAGVTDFDIIGFSYYPNWHTTVSFDNLPALVTQVKNKFNRKIMVLETAYAFTSENNDGYNNIFGGQSPIAKYPFSPDGQKQFLIDLSQNLIKAGASGIMYWEPAWVTSQMKDLWGTGSSWDNCTFFNFSGDLTGTIEFMQYDYQK
ncbi:MAG: arabinogalactan endo-1,4-beta-galactosidase [Bacteroidetes bacterium HGW-Bacteroidetes-4]|nr:MAG: arabinogalactan endo-1,4-beta-galactosidase [Bacteroidetes bacterium HGW-Bacteroidetes-4]